MRKITTIPMVLFWTLLFFLLSASMTCGSKQTTAQEPMAGLVERVKSKKVMIYGGEAALLNNEQLQSRFFLVRHAEKVLKQKDPDLLPKGKARAERLAEILDDISFRRIYSTNYRRTQLTAAPTASAMRLQVTNYVPQDFASIAAEILIQPGEGNYLFVGHSNSVPDMLNHLTGKEVYQNIPETVYDNLYIVSVYENKQVDVLELKY